MKRRRPRRIRVTERKLGREAAWGQCVAADRSIEIEPRQGERRRLNTLLHELLHVVFPRLSERAVLRAAGPLARALWAQHYRRIRS